MTPVPAPGPLQEAYASAFAEYLASGGEPALRTAYELGREAVRQQLSVLELAAVHHRALASALDRPLARSEIEGVTRVATEFLLESLSAFEMVQRGFWEATETARLEKEHVGRLRRLAEASLSINSTLSLQGITQVLADRAREVIGVQCSLAQVAADPRQVVEAISCATEVPWRELAAKVAAAAHDELSEIRTGQPLRRTQQQLDGDQGWRMLLGGFPRLIRGWLATSLVGRDGRDLGLVSLLGKVEGEFSEADESLLAQLAHMASSAIENANLYERERRVAETLQHRLLPAQLPQIPRIELAARYISGAVGINVGGDWYDVIGLPEGRVGIAVGDVLGRGASAAAVMGQVRTAFRAYALGGGPPETVVQRLDHLIQAMELDHFSTMIYAVLDPLSGHMSMVRAGHPPPLLLEPGGQTRFLEGGLRVPLGVAADAGGETLAESLGPGSTLVFYTDGLVETEEGLDKGLARLNRLLETLGPASPDLSALCDGLLGRMTEPSPEDDVALLLVRLASEGLPQAEPGQEVPSR